MDPYYADDLVTIYNGDSRDVLASLAGSVDMVLTDAPYNGDIVYGSGTNDSRSWDEYTSWLLGIIGQCETVSTGPVVCFVSKPGLMHLVSVRPPWWFGVWVGASGNPAGPNTGIMFQPSFEPCVFYGNRYGLKACVPDVWKAPVESNRLGHPCPKPLTLMRRMLGDFGPRSVLDPFMGSGTTLVAAKDLGIRAIGIEIEERYCEIAATRCSQEVLGLVTA